MPRPVHPPPIGGQGTDPPEPRRIPLEPLPLENDGPPLELLPGQNIPDPLEPPRFETWAE
jgi:hypothetical protein